LSFGRWAWLPDLCDQEVAAVWLIHIFIHAGRLVFEMCEGRHGQLLG
jgi:hypothetical protein